MSVTPKARGRHHHGDLRRALLDAVAEIVQESGPEAVTLRECARRAGVSHSAATPHFGDKRGLMTAFATEQSQRLREAMEAAVAALPAEAHPAEHLAATGRGYMAFVRDNPAHFRLMFRTDLIDTADPAWAEASSRARDPLDTAMRALVPGADDRAMRARLALAWAGVHGFCTLRAEAPRSDLWYPPPREAEVAEDLLALLLAACATDPCA
ncbi:TetR/AcrR family transcriptional regulator [Falsiroseomonas tokyonensis]|uniref:TetR/AcrR family transcriptional regulator n=1 Tax=Falsiroseomonas tokyonensis TaxID=430521 RepID=A0ABV7BT04_9PROT|nr:TetR/AcrR family transcriptional regulator [Falsiroseomonas tokyonensis]MBU8537217.1 TetR/AcrR family transcriptional regulator [Falsiroseomonas tokyonensis]